MSDYEHTWWLVECSSRDNSNAYYVPGHVGLRKQYTLVLSIIFAVDNVAELAFVCAHPFLPPFPP